MRPVAVFSRFSVSGFFTTWLHCLCGLTNGPLPAALPARLVAPPWPSLVSARAADCQSVCHAVHLRRRMVVLGRVWCALHFHRRRLPGVFRRSLEQPAGVVPDWYAAEHARRAGPGPEFRVAQGFQCRTGRAAAAAAPAPVQCLGPVDRGRPEYATAQPGRPACPGWQCLSERTGEQWPVSVLRRVPEQRTGLPTVL